MSVKKSMLVIWAVASVLWLVFFFYTLDIHKTAQIYRTHDRYEEKVARGQKTGYALRAYERTGSHVEGANKNLGLFLLIGFGLPGLMLAVGTVALENIDGPKRKNVK